MYTVSIVFEELDSAKKFAEVYSKCEPKLIFELFETPELNFETIDLKSFNIPYGQFEDPKLKIEDLRELINAIYLIKNGVYINAKS